ncbi:hypothetical protein ACVIHI_008312 [Bradyrhizobium sp. USDA 4524]|nr:hypothetical protein [Bradyrhizobium sp. USDA 4538]MCP1899329.1 hypothetical protein [Bradyrhizobium sp. USDA 4537]MCP1986559.1 hypothetical protein [Bradyrhizobium sp. USDA 4539]
MSAEWSKSAAGHTFNADVLRLDTFHYRDAWRWCVTDASDDVVAQGVTDNEKDAKAKAVAWARERLTSALRRLPERMPPYGYHVVSTTWAGGPRRMNM